VLTPLIMVGWNVGLENAGIVGNEITWTTALGLAVCLMAASWPARIQESHMSDEFDEDETTLTTAPPTSLTRTPRSTARRNSLRAFVVWSSCAPSATRPRSRPTTPRRSSRATRLLLRGVREVSLKGSIKVDLGGDHGVVQIVPRKTKFGRILDRDKAVKYFEERAKARST
jgi:hypothetical protein